MNPISLFIVILYFLLGCAKPNYQDDLGTAIQEAQSECAHAFTLENLCFNLIWDKKPTENDFGSFVLNFYNKQSPYILVSPKNPVQVVLWMPSMGHGSSPTKVEKISAGKYFVSEVFFIMTGKWEIRIQLKNGNEITEQVLLIYEN